MKSSASRVRWGTFVAFLLLLTLILSACGGGGEEQLPESTGLAPAAGEGALPAPGEQALLRCGESCASHGHCGNTLNHAAVMVGHAIADRHADLRAPVAAAGRQDMAVPAETIVTVREIRPQILVSPSGEEQLHNFFRVLVSGRNEEGWVASWCIVRAQ